MPAPVKRGPIQAMDTDPRNAALLAEIERRGRVIAQLTAEVEALRQAAESRAREGDLLEAELAAARKMALSGVQDTGRERAMIEELNAIISTQRELLVEKDEKIYKLDAALRRATRYSAETDGNTELPDVPRTLEDQTEAGGYEEGAEGGDARANVELDEARRLAQHRSLEIRSLRNALDDMAAKFDRVTVELRNAVLKLTETQQDNERLVSELASARDRLREKEFEGERFSTEPAQAPAESMEPALLEESLSSPVQVEVRPEPVWATAPVPRPEPVRAYSPPVTTPASDMPAQPATDIQHDQRVLVDALLRFLGRR